MKIKVPKIRILKDETLFKINKFHFELGKGNEREKWKHKIRELIKTWNNCGNEELKETIELFTKDLGELLAQKEV